MPDTTPTLTTDEGVARLRARLSATVPQVLTLTVLVTDAERERWMDDGYGGVLFAEDGARDRWLIVDADDGHLALRWADEDEYTQTGASGVTRELAVLPLPITIWGAR